MCRRVGCVLRYRELLRGRGVTNRKVWKVKLECCRTAGRHGEREGANPCASCPEACVTGLDNHSEDQRVSILVQQTTSTMSAKLCTICTIGLQSLSLGGPTKKSRTNVTKAQRDYKLHY